MYNYNTFEITLEEILKEFLGIINKATKPQHKIGFYWHDFRDGKVVLKLLKNVDIEAHELRGFYLAEDKYQKYLEKHPHIATNIKI